MYRLYTIGLKKSERFSKPMKIKIANKHIGIHPINPVLLDREENVSDISKHTIESYKKTLWENDDEFQALYIEDEDGELFECWYPTEDGIGHWLLGDAMAD